ncbi:MAG TPA: 5'/3'-nucleotidase SurE [Candidatus Binatia bacterium]|nr:5'/3'-nucleotidase SurE [Candidatus Binatia bacterium]
MRTLALCVSLLAVSPSVAPAAPLDPLRVLVTNDDGVKAPGIDALVQALSANPNVQVTVIVPATNQSGTGDGFTVTPITVSPSSTAGAFPATAVTGKPADTVLFGVLHALPQRPDLVVSGINFGQNASVELVNISGTVGAGLTAARLGIPAIAVSHGQFTQAAQFGEAANYVAGLVERFRQSRGFRAKMSTRSGARSALVLNVNFPTCSSGSTRGEVLVPLGHLNQVTGYTGSAPTFTPTVVSVSPFTADCTSSVMNPATDVDALANGFATLTVLNPDLTASPKMRGFRFLVR